MFVPLAPNSAANRVQTILTTEMEEEVVLFWDCGRKSKPLRDLALGECTSSASYAYSHSYSYIGHVSSSCSSSGVVRRT